MPVLRMTAETLSGKPRALLLHGGWPGHEPERSAAFVLRHVLQDFDVVQSGDLGMLCADTLAAFDLLIPVWTFGELDESAEIALLASVADGLGIVAWHGATSAFLASRRHKLLLGGQFVDHPGGDAVTYVVKFRGNDPLIASLDDFTVTSEQYYLLVDPAVKVLAHTYMDGGPMSWLHGVEMPVAWTRPWGRGRVFYCTLGHTPAILAHPPLVTLLRRAAAWASRDRRVEVDGG
ncbi:MAG: ThuA domain-containing protein [Burkholderiales bacterium]|nr:ThuA domain-containing protein [Burkholderiales bacterium]